MSELRFTDDDHQHSKPDWKACCDICGKDIRGMESNTVCSDDDVKSLKVYLSRHDEHITCVSVRGLVTRLECAEQVCKDYMNSLHPAQGFPESLKAWLESKGEAGG